MAELMIKGLTPNVSGAVPAGGIESEESKDAMQVFASLMSRTDGPAVQTGDLANAAKSQIKTGDTTFTPDSYKNKVVKDTPAAPDKLSRPETKETLQEINDKIKEAVMEEYDITEEELEQVMQTLGLDYIQLLLPENLVKLSVEITGAADSLELLSNTGFNNLFGLMQELTAEVTQVLDIKVTPEAVQDLATIINSSEASDLMLSEAPEQTPEINALNSAESLNQEDVYADINVVTEENTATANEADATLADKIETLVENGIQNGTVEVRSSEPSETDSTNPKAEQEAEQVSVQDQSRVTGVASDVEESANYGSQSNSSKENSDGSAAAKELLKPTAKEIKTENQNNTPNVAAFDNYRDLAPQTPIEAPAPLSQADTQSIIRQINDYMRINVSGPETSIEMQLNPENLGKVGISLSVRDGIVSAQIAVENAAVKNALEGQMVILRENMNNQGLKVEAVEVTIASHEFEQNLENGAPTGQEQQQSQQQSGRTTRSIRTEDMASIEDMPEEEQIAAKIMRDNGNSMDVTA